MAPNQKKKKKNGKKEKYFFLFLKQMRVNLKIS